MPLKKRAPKTTKRTRKAKPVAPKRKRSVKIPLKAKTLPQSLPQAQAQKTAESKREQKPRGFKFPHRYNDNRIVLMVRDPYWLYAYWEISDARMAEIISELKERLSSSSLILRVYDTSDWNFFDVNISERVGNWYINVGRPNTSFCVDIGYLTPDGFFVCAARSNIVKTPRDRMSQVIDEEWMIPDWEKMYALSGGFGRGKGSMEIKEMIERRQWISSPSSPVKKPKEQRNK